VTTATKLQHRLSVGSISDPAVRTMLAGQQVDVLYCDPPWSDGHMRVFARKASESAPHPYVPISWSEFMHSLNELIVMHVTGWVFVEMGNEQAEPCRHILSKVCADVVRHDIVYGSPKRPAALFVGHRDKGVAPTWELPAGASSGGLRQVKAVVASVGKPGQVLLDPCCGFGMSAKAALAAGMTFYGNEIDPRKAAFTRTLLENA
jgi:hypothetical protein